MNDPGHVRALWLRYGVAVLVPFAALALRVLLSPLLGDQSPLMLFILSGAVAAWWGGFGPGLVAFAIGGVLGLWAFIVPRFSWEVASLAERTRLISYGVVGIAVSALAEALHRSVRRERERAPALRESEERYRAYVATSHEAIWRIELDEPIPTSLPVDEQIRLYFERAYFAEVNDAVAGLYGFASAAEVAGLRVRDIEEPSRPATIDSMRQFITSDYRRTDEVSHEHDRSGTPRNFLNNYVGIVENGCLVRLWGSSLDITEHRRSEAALRETETTLRAFYESSPFCMGMVELVEDDILHVYDNPATCRLFEVPSGSTSWRWASELGLPPGVIVEWMKRYRECALRGGPVDFEMVLDLPGRSRLWLAATVSPLPMGPSGRPRFCYVALDVTTRRAFQEELVRAKEAAEAASRAKDDFLATLSHELRTPLNPVLLEASVSMNDASLSEDAREQWGMVYRNIALQARLVDDLLDLTRATRGKMSLRVQPLDLHRVVEQAVATVSSEAQAKRQSVMLELGATQTEAEGDAARLQQVLWNVLKNAIKFTPEGGSIRVETSNPGNNGHLRIAVRDTGHGMSPEELARIFDPFVQGDHAQPRGTHRFGGLGLGLAISRELIELHAGRIWAESEGRGQGAVFYVQLPVN